MLQSCGNLPSSKNRKDVNWNLLSHMSQSCDNLPSYKGKKAVK